jgi:hypothetical protein
MVTDKHTNKDSLTRTLSDVQEQIRNHYSSVTSYANSIYADVTQFTYETDA